VTTIGQALVVAIALGAPLGASAQGTTLRVEATARQLGLEDQLQLVISLEGTSVELREEIALPTLQNLQVVAGPSVSTQISFVNGRISQAKTYTYLLQPTSVGTAVIGAVRAVLADGLRTSEPITLEVRPGSLLPKRQPAPASPFGPGDQDPFGALLGRRQPVSHAKLFVEATASRTRLFVGESLLLTYSLFTQTAVAGLDFGEAPKYPGFWSEQLPQEQQPNQGEVVTRDGEQFTRFTVYRKLLFPTKAGSLAIPSATFNINVPRRAGLFADPFPSAVQTVARSTTPIDVAVDPPPADEPFSGAVGQFRATASLDHEAVDLGEAVTYRFRVEGRGNLKWVDKGPQLSLPDTKVYPPQTKDDFTLSPAGLSGSKTWEFVVVPQTSGVVTFPPLDFAYFDPSTARVSHVGTPALHLTVKSTARASTAPSVAVAAADRAAGSSLRLRSELDRPQWAVPSLGAGTVATILLAAGLAHGAIWGLPVLLTRRRGGESEGTGRSVRSALSSLRRAARGGMTKEAAAVLIEQAITDVFGDVDERPSAAEDARTVAVRQLLRDVRFVRFAPQLGDYSEKIREIAERAAAAVKRWA
jgi:hypothetical protein